MIFIYYIYYVVDNGMTKLSRAGQKLFGRLFKKSGLVCDSCCLHHNPILQSIVQLGIIKLPTIQSIVLLGIIRTSQTLSNVSNVNNS